MLSKTFPQQLTSLDRKIDLSYPSNRFALLIAVVAACVALFFGSPWWLVVSSAFWAFATWALGRELDPDHALTAALSSSSIVLLLAVYPPVRASAFQALGATGVLVLTARAALGSTGRALTWVDQLLVAVAPVVADALTGLPLRLLGLSSFGALFGRLSQVLLPTRSGRFAQQLVWALTGFGVAWLVVQTLLGSTLLLPSQLMTFTWFSGLMSLILVVLGAMGLTRHLPNSKADNGNLLSLEHFYWQRMAIFVGSIVAAIFTPWILWFGLGVVGLFAVLFDRLPQDS